MYASHNSLTAYPVKRWYMKLLQPFSRCQEKGIDEQINAGVKFFDIRLRIKNGKEAFNKTIKTLILDEKERNMRNRSY